MTVVETLKALRKDVEAQHQLACETWQAYCERKSMTEVEMAKHSSRLADIDNAIAVVEQFSAIIRGG